MRFTSFLLTVAFVLANSLQSAALNDAGLVVDATLGLPIVVPISSGQVGDVRFFPDGHLPAVPNGNGHLYFSAGVPSHRLEVDAEGAIIDSKPVLDKGNPGSFDNGGAWLYSVIRDPFSSPTSLVGFYHAEYHWLDDFIAWKSIALATSLDNGNTWLKGGEIIRSPGRPSIAEWGGDGDHCVVWDPAKSRWMCFFTNSTSTDGFIKMAATRDADYLPGKWFKYYNGGFTEPGLDGKEDPIPGLMAVKGSNPSVHFNTELNRWIMVYHSWEEGVPSSPTNSKSGIWISWSWDLEHWEAPMHLLAPTTDRYSDGLTYAKIWNPTIVGVSDLLAGKTAKLFYSGFQLTTDGVDASGQSFDPSSARYGERYYRVLVQRDITFNGMKEVPPSLDFELLLLNGTMGASFATHLNASSNTTSIVCNSLPPGLVCSSSGTISGSPTRGGVFVGSAVATNGAGSSPVSQLVFFVDAVATASVSGSASVTFDLPLASAIGKESITATPSSGSLFQVGTTTVTVTTVPVTTTDEDSTNKKNTFTVTVNSPVTITSQPSPLTVNGGSLASFSVTATGTAPLSYQWSKNGATLAGGTSSTYTIASAQTTDAGSYSVVVSNSAGSVTSGSASLTVNSVSVYGSDDFSTGVSTTSWLVIQANNGTMSVLAPNGHASFLVTGNSTDEQNACIFWNGRVRANADWSAEVRGHNAAAYSSNGSSSLQLWVFDARALTGGSAYGFDVEFSRGNYIGLTQAGFQYSTSSGTQAHVIVPASQSITDFKLRVIYRAATQVFESWYDDSGSGANWKLIRISPLAEVVPDATPTSEFVVALMADSYYGPISEGQLWADDFRLVNTVLEVPVISTQPANRSVTSGSLASFSVSAAGTAPLSYQWSKNGATLAGGTSSTYVIASAQTLDAGSYSVVVSNSAGSVTSGSASLTVNKGTPTIYTWPTASSISSGQMLASSVLSGGSASVLGAFAFSSSSTAPNVGTGTQSVTFTPTDSTRYNTVSGNVSVTVNAVATPPSVTSSPVSLTVNGGSLASFSVTATGAAPLSYRWSKNGATLAGGTSSTYVIASAQTTDAGSYSVVVSNSAGSVTSGSASLTVNKTTPVITILPTASAITSGQTLSSSVLSGGSASVAGAFTFTSPSTVPSVGTASQPVTFTPADSSRYTNVSTSVSITVNTGVSLPVITSATTANGTVGSVFNYQIAGTNTPSSFSATGLPVGLNVNLSTGLISGTPTIAGQSLVTLGAANSAGNGSSTLTLSILSAGTGNTGTVNWTDLAGTYEGLLEDATEAGSSDGAIYRGSFVMTFARSGVVSGRVFYNEAPELEGGLNRYYRPVIRTFSGALSAVSGTTTAFQKVIKLGAATPRGSEELTLDVSFVTSPPTVNVTVKDFVSPATGEDEWVSKSMGCTRSLGRLSAVSSVGGSGVDYVKAVGRYILSATDLDLAGGQANDAYVLVQALTTGKLLWTSRMKGTFGCGSAGLRLTEEGLGAAFYEGRMSSTLSLFKSTSLLGGLRFTFDPTASAWTCAVGSDSLPDKLEKQASCVFKSAGKLAYDDSEGKNWTGVTALDFSNKDGVRWGNTTVAIVPAFLSAPLSFTLSAQDPLLDLEGNTVSYAWSVSIAANGKVSAVPNRDDSGILAPRLLLTLDRTRGEVGGYYMSSITGKNVRRNLYGCGLLSQTDEALCARGWVESGVLPALSTGGWTLQLGP